MRHEKEGARRDRAPGLRESSCMFATHKKTEVARDASRPRKGGRLFGNNKFSALTVLRVTASLS